MRLVMILVALIIGTTTTAQIKLDENKIVELKEIGSLPCPDGKKSFINYHSGKEKFYWTYRDESETAKAKYESITFYGSDDYDQLRDWIFEHLGSGEVLEIQLGSSDLSILFDKTNMAIEHDENGEHVGYLKIDNSKVKELFQSTH